MRLIESSYVIVPQDPGLEGIYKQIEKAGRLCYKSEDKICEGSAEKMVNFLSNRGHGSPLEHGTVYLQFSYCTGDPDYLKLLNSAMFYDDNPYSKITVLDRSIYSDVYVTTNFRVLFENDRLEDLQYLCEPTDYHEKRYSVKITCSRSIANEFVRHRVMSFCQESQRYVGYDKEKFGGEIVFVIPDWVKTLMNNLSEDDFADCQHEDVKC